MLIDQNSVANRPDYHCPTLACCTTIMPKRKSSIAEDDDDSGSDVDVVNVDFEFFDPRPIDYLAIKRLLNQLFGPDAESLGTSDLTDLILSQPLLGTTVKIDGIDSDPYAFLTVLNLNVHKASDAERTSERPHIDASHWP